MKKLILIAGLSLFAGSAYAGPLGTWRVEDGTSTVAISRCGDALCGTVASTDKPDQKDSKNPDLAKRNRSVLGITVLHNMKPEGSKWTGSIYNPRDGRVYPAKISVQDEDTIHIEGCIMGGMLCGGQDWSRVAQPNDAADSTPQPPKETFTAAPTPNFEPPSRPDAQLPDHAQGQQPSPATKVKEHSNKHANAFDFDVSKITGGQAADAGRTAADLINQILNDHGVGGARVDRGQAASAARSAAKMFKSSTSLTE